MLFIKEFKKICFSLVYVLFLGLLLFNWHDNFYGVTEQEIKSANSNQASVYTAIMGGSVLEKPKENAESYGSKYKEDPEKIMCGGTDNLIMEYHANSYATYPYSYYKKVVLSNKEQAQILSIIKEITGLSEEQIDNLPDDYFPVVNGNIFHSGAAGEESNGKFTFDPAKSNSVNNEDSTDFTKHFISQVSYERFKELMAQAENIIGKGSNYSMENLLEYYGLSDMSYEERMDEYDKTIYDDKVSNAFARLFCDYMTRTLGLYPVFLVAVFWLKDKRNRINELIDSKQIKTSKLLITRFTAMLTAVMLPVVLLSFESLIPLMKYSANTGIAIDIFAFLKYILWWLLPTAMIVTSLGMFLTILTSTPLAILVQFIWWFIDSASTRLTGDTDLFTLMIRHNTLNGSELITQNFTMIWLNRGLWIVISLVFVWLSIFIYNNKRGGKLDYGFIKKRFSNYIQK